MTLRAAISSSVWLVGALVMTTAAAWWWRSTIFHAKQPPPAAAPWKHVQEQYPLPSEPAEVEKFSSEVFDAILAANPFSPDRSTKPATGASSADGLATPIAAAPAPKFVYKGLVKLGNRQRAIVEDVTSRKTHFLEVGQEVAGFKVLDIAENRVVLSDPQTKEEVVVSVAPKASR